MSKGELSEALIQTTQDVNDYVNLYNSEYERSNQLQNRIDRLKIAQKNAQLIFKGFIS